MAETAEIYRAESAPAFEVQVFEEPYVAADRIPELQFVRRRAREEAHDILARHRQLLCEGAFEAVPLPVDALGTARRALEAKAAHGIESEDYQELMAGLVLDCRRLYAEATRKNTYEYFPLTRQEFDPITQEYYSHGQSILGLTEQGLSPVAETEERDRRINERVEEVTYRAIGRLGLQETVQVLTISECTDWAIAAHQRQSKGGYGGYVPEIEKLMVRNVIFPGGTHRYEEQVGLRGTFITHDVVVEALRRRGIQEPGTKTEVHATQLLHNDDVFDFVALLDTIASERSGQSIYMGEVLRPGEVADYATVRHEALARQEALDVEATHLADYVLELEEHGTDGWVAVRLVEDYVKQRLLRMATIDTARAAHMFDEKTAEGLRQVSYLHAIGQSEDALKLLSEVEAQAPAPGYCGAGSCGLETVNLAGTEGKELLKLLKAEAGDTIVKDTERTCRCGRKDIVYAYNKNKVNKLCKSCGAFESKVSKAA